MVFIIVTGAHAQSDTLNNKVTSVFDNGGKRTDLVDIEIFDSVRYDTLLDVRGAVKSVLYDIETSEDLNYIKYYTIKQVDYLPRGNRWSFTMSNKELHFVNFGPYEENGFEVNCMDDSDLDAHIVFITDSKNKRIRSRELYAAPEYDGYNIIYKYDENGEIKGAELIGHTWDVYKNRRRETSQYFDVTTSDLDKHGNWTYRKFRRGLSYIIVKRTIKYYAANEVIEPVTDWGNHNPFEIVGDFNGDGKTEKAWVDSPYDANGDLTDSEEAKDIYLYFSEKKLTPVNLGEAIGFTLQNIGDINGDGCDDIGTTIVKFASAWNIYSIWVSSKGNNWHKATSFQIRAEMFDDFSGPDFIPIRRTNGGEVEIWYAEENEYNEYDENWVPWSYRLKKIKLK